MDLKSEASDDTTNQRKQKEMQMENVDNLEYFPLNVLLNIFAQTDDLGLLYSSEISSRFATITPIVFEKRYANKYFVINGEYYGGDHDIYGALFNRFGQFIKAIEINHIDGIDNSHWLMDILQKHINHIEKLAFNHCHFVSSDILSQATSIKHLLLRHVYCSDGINFPECRDLEELEVLGAECILDNSLNRIICNSPSLQSLGLNNRYVEYATIASIADSLNHLKALTIAKDEYGHRNWTTAAPGEIDKISTSLENLESLTFTVCFDNIELLQRLGLGCKCLKHLKLRIFGVVSDIQVIEAVRSFRQIESLHILPETLDDRAMENVMSLVEHLPHLRVLCFEAMISKNDIYLDILCLFQKCHTLEKITNVLPYRSYDSQAFFMDARIYKDFIETVITRKPNARIEVEEYDQIIASISKNGIVWRNKLVHWTGCDSNQSSTKVHLLDLAKHAVKSDAVQRNLLDRIFDYLDVHSLEAFAETAKRCKQSIESYVPNHSQQHRTFTITDEFKSYDSLEESTNFDPSIFSQHVTDLKIDHSNSTWYLDDIDCLISNYKNLKKLSIYSDCGIDFYYLRLLQQVQHFSFDIGYFIGYRELNALSEHCPNVETVAFKKASSFNDFKSGTSEALKFRNLKKFVFGSNGSETQMNNLKKMFENTDTQLVPIPMHQN